MAFIFMDFFLSSDDMEKITNLALNRNAKNLNEVN